jgi:hypothetical protein
MAQSRMMLTKFVSYHEYQEIEEMAITAKIVLPVEKFPTKQELVKYLLDNGFKLGG